MAKLPADTTLTPFLSNSGSGTASFSDKILRVMASAIGERQVLPLQTNRIVVLNSRSMIRSS